MKTLNRRGLFGLAAGAVAGAAGAIGLDFNASGMTAVKLDKATHEIWRRHFPTSSGGRDYRRELELEIEFDPLPDIK